MFMLALVFNSQVFGQTTPSDEWRLIQEKNGVNFYYKVSSCYQYKVILFRFQNTTPTAVNFNFKGEIKDGDGLSVKKFENYQLKLQANQTIEGSCTKLADSLTGDDQAVLLERDYKNPQVSLIID
jgi:hypothetical protein